MKIIPINKVFTKETAGPNIIESGIKVIKKIRLINKLFFGFINVDSFHLQ